MKAYVFEKRLALDELKPVERPIPTPKSHEILVAMRAVSLNFRDLAIARGDYGNFPCPLVPLSDGAGEVVACGASVTRFSKGDLVCAAYVPDWIDGPVSERVARRRLGGPSDGVLAEYICVDESAAVRAPAHFDAREAATLPVAAVTAYEALFRGARLAPGDVVAVQGSGGLSLSVLQLARAVGARVLALTRDDSRRERLERLGAEVFVVSDSRWDVPLRAATNGEGVDVFVDVVGGPSLQAAVNSTRFGKTLLLLGFVAGQQSEVDLVGAIRRAITLRAVSGGSRESFEALTRGLQNWQLRPVIDRVFALRDLHAAFEHLARGRPFGKVVVEF
ncbi:MAG TPA: NAD(P)-dependent alcohol dehydrogenase [Polyangiaceae bacterium]|nr:NAD(P)-dependent alcohol dehydrogenase [Polyangiaceae bacterium]